MYAQQVAISFITLAPPGGRDFYPFSGGPLYLMNGRNNNNNNNEKHGGVIYLFRPVYIDTASTKGRKENNIMDGNV